MGEIRLSCYAGPWGPDGVIQAISDVSECGFDGLEFYCDIVQTYEDRLHVFEEILETASLSLSGLMQRINLLEKDHADEQVERAANSARFNGLTGRGNLIITHSMQSADLTKDDWVTAAAIIEEIGFRCEEFGIQLCFMPRAGYLGSTEKEIRHLLDITNPEVVFLAMDTREFVKAGINPAKAVGTFKNRLKSVRFRDLSGAKRKTEPAARPDGAPKFGRGIVDFAAVAKALLDIDYDGWVTVDISGEQGSAADTALAAYRFVLRNSGLFPY